MFRSTSKYKYRRLRPTWLIASVLLVVVSPILAACGNDEDDSLLVFAAASLKDALTEISEQYESESGVGVDISFGGSQSLAQQITAGAPADVFIAAGQPPMDFLVEREYVDQSGVAGLLGNELVVVTLKDGPDIDSLVSLTSDVVDRLALADPRLAPAGAYSEEALRTKGLWDALQTKILFGGDVRATMSYVQAGNADAGIVYRTDAASTPSLNVVYSVPRELYTPIVYPGAVIAESDTPDAAANYLEFLRSAEAISTFARYGFVEAAK